MKKILHRAAAGSIRIAGSIAVLSLSVAFSSSKVMASAGTEGASFLDIPVGAGPAALGSAYTALAANAYAPVWNPAGLGFVNGTELAGQHLSYLESINYEYLSAVHAFDKPRDSNTTRGIGISAQYLGTGDIPKTDVQNGSPVDLGSFSSYYGAYNLSYGQTLTDKLAVGVTGKLISAKIDDVSANAYAADLGTLYKMNDKLNLAATVTNLGTKLKFISEGDSLPMSFHLAAAYQPSSHYLVTSEGVYEENGLASFRAGAQWRPLEAIALRAGYRTDTLKGLDALAGVSAGIGITAWGQELAYAWVPYGDLGNTQYFSLLVRFGEQEEERRNLIHYQTIKKHRTAQGDKAISEPEYQQLMQLLSDDDTHTAQVGHATDAGNQ